MHKIMIIEDENGIRTELKMILENALYEVILIEEFKEVVEQILSTKLDVVLLDMNLPNKSGLEICSELRRTSDIPVIFVTSNNTSMDELNCITLGGDDYISKPYNAPIFLARISRLLKRVIKSIDNDSNVLSYKGIVLDILSAKIKYKDKEIELSKNELKILYYLFNNTEKIIPRIELVEFLWDNEVFIDDNTLSVNITRIRGKLESIGVEDFIQTKRGLGYRI